VGWPCPVRDNCQTPRHCPYCVDGSEYTPRDRRVVFPSVAARQAARRAARRAWRYDPRRLAGLRARRKGRQGERDAVQFFRGTAVPGSGQLDGLPNDVVVALGWRAEVKRYASAGRRLYQALAHAEAVVVPGLPTLWAMDGRRFRAGPGEARWPLDAPAPEGWRVTPMTTPLRTMRRWLATEHADVLLVRADQQGWLAVMDEAHARAWHAAGGG
jgi:hypothetical protein